MAQHTPTNGEPYNPAEEPKRQVIQVSDPMADIRQQEKPQLKLPDGQVQKAQDEAADPTVRKRLVHPFPLGQVHDDTLQPPRQILGQVANPQMPGRTFEISVLGNGQPVVQSNQSCNFWTISWSTLIKLALAEGIEREVKPKKPTIVGIDGKPLPPSDG